MKKLLTLLSLTIVLTNLFSQSYWGGEWTENKNFGFTTLSLDNSVYANSLISPIISSDNIYFVNSEMKICRIIKNDLSNYGTAEVLVPGQRKVRENSNLIYYNNHVYFIGDNDRLYDIYNNGSTWSNGTYPTGGWSTKTIRKDSKIILDSNKGIFYVSINNEIHRIYYQNGWNGGIDPVVSGQTEVRSNSNLIYYNNHVYFVGVDNRLYDIFYNGSSWSNGSYPTGGLSTEPIRENSEIILDAALGLFYIGKIDSKIYRIYYDRGWHGGIDPLISNQDPVRANSKLFFYNKHVYFINSENEISDVYFNGKEFSNGVNALNPEASAVKLNSDLVVNSEGLFYISSDHKVCYLIWDYIDNDRHQAWSFGYLNEGSVNSGYSKIVYSSDCQDMYFIDYSRKLKVFTRLIKNPLISTVYGDPIFSEEFNGDFSYAGWKYKFNDGSFRAPTESGNFAYTTQKEENFEFDTDNLTIQTRWAPGEYLARGTFTNWDPVLVHYDYTTGMLNTGDNSDMDITENFYFKYGYLEIRCKIPACAKTGFGFWMTGYYSGWPPEIDIFEFLGSQEIVMTNHWRHDSDKQSYSYRERPIGYRFYDNFYTYGLKWEANKLIWYLNNEKIAEFIGENSDEVSDYFMRVMLTTRVHTYDTDLFFVEDMQENFPNEIVVDYIRVYQNKISRLKSANGNSDDLKENNFNNNDENIDISIYPNPASDYLEVNAPPKSVVNIFDMSGKLVFTSPVFNNTKIDVTNLKIGV
ncbi:MAG: family 16 glycosylhydrolase [Salinivirgaceae bacterium]|nr:family 16 glycosylhydrolase [Salinivirgaceae bacterium]